MDKEKLIRHIERLIETYKEGEDNNPLCKGAAIAMTSLLETINEGHFDKS